MNIAIHSDLSCVIVSDDEMTECRLPSYNPETLVPFSSEDEVRRYAQSIEGRPHFFTPRVTQVPSVKVSPVEFKLLFTSTERVAVKQSEDPVVIDFFSIIEDPRLTHVDLGLQSTREGLDYLVEINILTPSRRDEILSGQVR